MNIQIFGTKKCNDTKKAERFFKERGIKYQFIDMKEKGMSKGEFTSVAQANGGLENMINWEGRTKSGGLRSCADRSGAETDQDILALIKYISKKPSFRSDRYQFTVVMPNLNYDVPQDVPQDKLDVQIVDLIRKDRKISTEKMANVLGVSSKTIKRHIKEMNNVCYVGRGFSGHWEIEDDE